MTSILILVALDFILLVLWLAARQEMHVYEKRWRDISEYAMTAAAENTALKRLLDKYYSAADSFSGGSFEDWTFIDRSKP